METFSDSVEYFHGLPGYFRTNAVTFNYNNVFFHIRIRMGEGFIFKCSNFFLHAQQVINVVITIEQAGFFIRADFKFFFQYFFVSACETDFLLFQIHRDDRSRILFQGNKDFFQDIRPTRLPAAGNY